MDENVGKILVVRNLDLWENLILQLESYGRVKSVDFSHSSNCFCVEFFNEASAAACKQNLDGRINIIDGKRCEVQYIERDQPPKIPVPMAGEDSSGLRQQMMSEQALGHGSGSRSLSNMAPMSGLHLGFPMGLDLGLLPPMSSSDLGLQALVRLAWKRSFGGQMIASNIHPQTTMGQGWNGGYGGLVSTYDLHNQPTMGPGLNLALGCPTSGFMVRQGLNPGFHFQTAVQPLMTTPLNVGQVVLGSGQNMGGWTGGHLSGYWGQTAASIPHQSGNRSRGETGASSREEQRLRSSPRSLVVEEQRSRSRAADCNREEPRSLFVRDAESLKVWHRK